MRERGAQGPGRWLARLAVAAALLAAAGCGEDDKSCSDHAATVCEGGVSTWLDSCGERQEQKQTCRCGCDDAGVECEPCDCTCSAEDACCDGCFAINTGGECSDGDDGTTGDVCLAGSCLPGMPPVAPPAAPAEPAEAAPVALASWICEGSWASVAHDSLLDGLGQPLRWCEPPALPRLALDELGYVTPLEDGEQQGDRPICNPAGDGTFPLVGEATCQPLGHACPAAGAWPDVPAEITGARIYVRAGAAGTGTSDAPFGSIAGAVAAAAPGDVIVIGPGEYPEAVTVDKDLTLWGACVQQSVIAAPGPFDAASAALLVEGAASVAVHGLRISGEQAGLRVAGFDASASLQGVWIHAATAVGLEVESSAVQAEGLLITATKPGDNATTGRGIVVESRGSLTAQRVLLEANRVAGAEISGTSTTADLADAAVRNTLGSESNGSLGRGLDVRTGAKLSLTRGLLHGNREAGLSTYGSGAKSVIEQVVVRATASEESTRGYGEGLWTDGRGILFATRVLVEANHNEGVFANGSGTLIELTDAIVRDTEGLAATGVAGEGVWVQEGAQGVLTRVLIENNRHVGLFAGASGASLALEDVLVADTREQQSDDAAGVGLWVEGPAEVTGTRVQLERNRMIGLWVQLAEAEVALEDLIVRGTRAQASNDQLGTGIQVNSQASLGVTRGLIENNRNYGVLIANRGTTGEFEDLIVRNTECQLSDRLAGGGMALVIASQATVRRGLLEGNRQVGATAWDADTVLDLEDVTIRDTRYQEADERYGRGLEADRGARIVLVRGLIAGNRNAGISATGRNSTLALTDVEVRDTEYEEAEGYHGYGMLLSSRASAVLTRGLFDTNRAVGVWAFDPGTVLEATDLEIRGTWAEQATRNFGYGLWVNGGAAVILTRGLLAENHSAGLGAVDGGTAVTLTDVAVRDTRVRFEGKIQGLGVQANAGATITWQRGWVTGNHGVGMILFGVGTTASLEDLVIRDTLSREATLDYGRGLSVAVSADVTLTRGLIAGNREIGVCAGNTGTLLALDTVAILDTGPVECSEGEHPTCVGAGGLGLGVYDEAAVQIAGVEIGGVSLAGLQLSRLGAVGGSGLWIHDNPIGANLQKMPEGYDLFSEIEGLLMEDNQVNFDATELVLPGSLDEILQP